MKYKERKKERKCTQIETKFHQVILRLYISLLPNLEILQVRHSTSRSITFTASPKPLSILLTSSRLTRAFQLTNQKRPNSTQPSVIQTSTFFQTTILIVFTRSASPRVSQLTIYLAIHLSSYNSSSHPGVLLHFRTAHSIPIACMKHRLFVSEAQQRTLDHSYSREGPKRELTRDVKKLCARNCESVPLG